ncbi:unnamed protein product [Chrysoparadoxa australica]
MNEALANFDEADTLPVWPTPRKKVYVAPEQHGEAALPEPGMSVPLHSKRSAAPKPKAAAPNSDHGVEAELRHPQTLQEDEEEAGRSSAGVSSGARGEHMRQSSLPEAEAAAASGVCDEGEQPAEEVDEGVLLAQVLNEGERFRKQVIAAMEGTKAAGIDLDTGLDVGIDISCLAGCAELDELDDGRGGAPLPVERRLDQARLDHLLQKAGPPPSSMAFPTLAVLAVERGDALAAVRFVRVCVNRLVMFGSMTSAPDGCGWQLRWHIPPASAAPRGEEDRVSMPIPARSSPSQKIGLRGKPAKSSSMARSRKGCGAADLLVGETRLDGCATCAVNMTDTTCQQWLDAEMVFLVVDGTEQGVPRLSRKGKPSGKAAILAATNSSGGNGSSSSSSSSKGLPLVRREDRVVALGKLRLRDVLLSPELAKSYSVDLMEVVDIWGDTDRHANGSARTGRNPYRGKTLDTSTLALGKRAVGALGVSLELLPGDAMAAFPAQVPRAGADANEEKETIAWEGRVEAQAHQAPVRPSSHRASHEAMREQLEEALLEQARAGCEASEAAEAAEAASLLVRISHVCQLTLGHLSVGPVQPSVKAALLRDPGCLPDALRVCYRIPIASGATEHREARAWPSSRGQKGGYEFGHSAAALVAVNAAAQARWGSGACQVFEVWGMVGGEEALVGLARVSLAPFAGGARADHPLVAADGVVPITDPFSGSQVGLLGVELSLALGEELSLAASSLPTRQAAAPQPAAPDDPVVAVDAPRRPVEPLEAASEAATDAAAALPAVGADEAAAVEQGADVAEAMAARQVPEETRVSRPPQTEATEARKLPLTSHVLEIAPEGEVHFETGLDAPALGCAITYALPGAGAPLQQLWWDSDSSVLNSRARHCIKVPAPDGGFIPDEPEPEQAALLGKLCTGEDGITFALHWSAGAAPGNVEEGGGDGRLLGTAQLTRQHLAELGIGSRSSVTCAVSLAVKLHREDNEESHVDGPEQLRLLISYRREPYGVLRRHRAQPPDLLHQQEQVTATDRDQDGDQEHRGFLPEALVSPLHAAGTAATGDATPSPRSAVMKPALTTVCIRVAAVECSKALVQHAAEAALDVGFFRSNLGSVEPEAVTGVAPLTYHTSESFRAAHLVKLDWRLEIPVVITSAFVEFLRKGALKLTLRWRGSHSGAEEAEPEELRCSASGGLALEKLLGSAAPLKEWCSIGEGGRAKLELSLSHHGAAPAGDETDEVGKAKGVEEHVEVLPQHEIASEEGKTEAAGEVERKEEEEEVMESAGAEADVREFSNELSAPAAPVFSLLVDVERAAHLTPGADGHPPVTLVTCEWQRDGAPPVRPLFRVLGAEEGEGVMVTEQAEASLAPLYEAAAELCCVDKTKGAEDLCCERTALVLKVWRRGGQAWWEEVKGARIGDKLIGAAVVPLGALAQLEELHGWYHILDDMQREQGQIKVRVRPSYPLCAATAALSTLDAVVHAAAGASDSSEEGGVSPSSRSASEADSEGWKEDIARVHALLAAMPLASAETVNARGSPLLQMSPSNAASPGQPLQPLLPLLQDQHDPFVELLAEQADADADADAGTEAVAVAGAETHALASALQQMTSAVAFAANPNAREEAAVRVQARIRGALGRRASEVARLEHEERERAAARAQALYRGHLARRLSALLCQQKHEALAATKVQASWRGLEGRRASIELRAQAMATAAAAAREMEACEVQRVWRGYQGRQRARELREEALTHEKAAAAEAEKGRKRERLMEKERELSARVGREWEAAVAIQAIGQGDQRGGASPVAEGEHPLSKADAEAIPKCQEEDDQTLQQRAESPVPREPSPVRRQDPSPPRDPSPAPAEEEKRIKLEAEAKCHSYSLHMAPRPGSPIQAAVGIDLHVTIPGQAPLHYSSAEPSPSSPDRSKPQHGPTHDPSWQRITDGESSTFYGQLGQDPRSGQSLPEAHVAFPYSAAAALSCADNGAGAATRVLSGAEAGAAVTRGKDMGAGVLRPRGFADAETERIARIMKGSLGFFQGIQGQDSDSSWDFMG